MNAIALICVRGGSRGLPGKNIRLLAGKPLVVWAIEAAKSVNRIYRVIVSTDSEEIASIARDYQAETPFIRPSELARDDSPEWLVWRHTVKYLRDIEGVCPDALVIVPATAPLRLPIDIENCLDEYEKGEVDVVVTVTAAHRNPYFNMVKMMEDDRVELVIPTQTQIFRRQDVPAVYDLTTVAYAVRPEFVLKCNGIFKGRVRAVKVPAERALDIDTLMDFKIAECLMGSQIFKC